VDHRFSSGFIGFPQMRHTDGHDFPGHVDELALGEAAVVEDVVVGFEDTLPRMNCEMSGKPTSTVNAIGIVSNRRLSWLVRCQARSSFSIVLICNLSSISCATGGRSAVRARAGRSMVSARSPKTLSISARTCLMPLRDHDPKLRKMRPERVRQHRLLPDQKRPRAMQHENSLLIGALDRHKPHVRPGHRLANSLRICGVVLPTLDIGFT
jgi:hypothetical protein